MASQGLPSDGKPSHGKRWSQGMDFSIPSSHKYIVMDSFSCSPLNTVFYIYYKKAGLPHSGKKFRKMKTFPGQGKVRELHFQSGKFKKKMKKVVEKSGNFKIFLKRC